VDALGTLLIHCVPHRTIDEVEEYFPGFKAFIDSAEQEIPRPKNKRRRKIYYSGRNSGCTHNEKRGLIW
jgi:hypothetical protein